MFDQLFKHASTIARHATAPFAEERSRYLEFCGQRGDSFMLQLRKADHLLWIARKLGEYSDLQLSIDQVREVVSDCNYGESTSGPKLHLLSTRKRLIGTACAWLRYLGYFRELVEQIPFGSRLDEYCDWAKQERGLSDATIGRFRRTIRQFLRWYGPLGQPLSGIHVNDVDAYLAVGSDQGWKRVTIRNTVDALRAFFRFLRRQTTVAEAHFSGFAVVRRAGSAQTRAAKRVHASRAERVLAAALTRSIIAWVRTIFRSMVVIEALTVSGEY